MNSRKLLVILVVCYVFSFILCSPILAQQNNSAIYMEGVINRISSDEAQLNITSGNIKGQQLKAKINPSQSAKSSIFKVGDEVMISYAKAPDGNEVVYIVDYVRKKGLFILFLVFLAFVFIVGRVHGFTSFIGMLLSFGIITQFIIPQIMFGNDPVVIALFGSLFIIPITFYVSHGVSSKTTISVVGTLLALILTGIIAYVFVDLVKLTGYASEEASYLQLFTGGTINIKNLLLGGIIIATLGILDDISISQTGIVFKLAETNPRYGFKELYSHSMELGRDHIASLVNTLILVYAGASLPLFLLFYNTKVSYGFALNQEIIATEIVRTLVSSIGIIAAVPITTLIACWYKRK